MSYKKSTRKPSDIIPNPQDSYFSHSAKASDSNSPRYKDRDSSPFVSGCSDQFDEKWICVERGGQRAFASLDTFMTNQQAFFLRLKNQGVIIATPMLRAAIAQKIDAIVDWKLKIYVARSTGWHGDCFIKPDHSIIGKPPKRSVLELTNSPVHLARKGSFEGWANAVQTFAAGQSTLMISVCLAYLGPLLPLMGNGNVGLDLTGRSSIGKSSALDLAASVWGAPLRQPGSIAASLRTTDNAAEQSMLSRANALLALDEVNLLGIDARKQAEALGNLVFLIAEGVEKFRYDDPTAMRVSVASMVTSNKSILDQARQYDHANAEAAAVRFITVNADACTGHGVFDYLPHGYESSGDAVLAMKAALANNHGHSIDLFLQRLVDSLKRDHDGVVTRIDNYQQDFMQRCSVAASDGLAHRRALAFAAIYAAGRLATHFGALPLKNIGKSVMACYVRSLVAISGTTAIERVQTYLAANNGQLYDLDKKPRPKLRGNNFDLHPGFLKRRMGRRCLLMRKTRWESEFGNDANTMLIELNTAGLLQTTEGRQLQIKVRQNRDKDRVYAVIID